MQKKFLENTVKSASNWDSLTKPVFKKGRPQLDSEGKNHVSYWLYVDDFCGQQRYEGAFYTEVHILLWMELRYDVTEATMSNACEVNLDNLKSEEPFDMFLYCDNQPRKGPKSKGRWLFEDLMQALKHSKSGKLSTCYRLLKSLINFVMFCIKLMN